MKKECNCTCFDNNVIKQLKMAIQDIELKLSAMKLVIESIETKIDYHKDSLKM